MLTHAATTMRARIDGLLAQASAAADAFSCDILPPLLLPPLPKPGTQIENARESEGEGERERSEIGARQTDRQRERPAHRQAGREVSSL